ncbi:ATP-binding cassette domain-containing protein [Enterococcus sp. AZ192]|uniref:ABC transporter ATP-binding protein/permease n=1 Tax=unclassified Enterococcus TaxID=2608891 RepID=UPI003D2B647D
MIYIKNITKSYQLKDENVTVLKDISFDITTGLTYIIGKSGSGKSTLLNIIGGIDQASGGQIYYDEVDVSRYSEKEWAEFRKKNVGFIFQSFNLLDHLTALENVEISLMLAGVEKKKRREKARALLEKVHMEEYSRHRPGELSGGQKQRIAIARALANDPEVILADEPTGALDSKNSDEVMTVLKEISEELGKTVVVITHSEKYRSLADQMIHLKDGRIEEIKQSKVTTVHNQKTNNSSIRDFSLLSTLKLACSNMKKRKARTFITALGASVGIFGILMITFLVAGLTKQMNSIASDRVGENTLVVSSEDKQLSPVSDRQKLARLDDVALVYETNRFRAQLDYDGKQFQAEAINIAPKEEGIAENYVDWGKAPLNADEIALSKSVAKQLFTQPTDALNKKLIVKTQLITADTTAVYPVKSTEFTVTGIFKNEDQHQANVEMSYVSAEQLMQGEEATKNLTNYFTIVPQNLNNVDTLIKQVNEMNYSSDDNTLASMKNYLNIARSILIVLSSISLIVSTLLICVVLYISVAERTKEIGIMKALGATPINVQRLFLVEGGLIGLAGGTLGLISALGISQALNTVIEHAVEGIKFHFFSFDLAIIFILLVFSIAIGVLAAYFPARSASKKVPLEALRFE